MRLWTPIPLAALPALAGLLIGLAAVADPVRDEGREEYLEAPGLDQVGQPGPRDQIPDDTPADRRDQVPDDSGADWRNQVPDDIPADQRDQVQ